MTVHQSRQSWSGQWRQAILSGIATLPVIGAPGRVAAFGDEATPVLCGDKEEDVVLACCELGRGRIAAVGHDGYLEGLNEGHDGYLEGLNEGHVDQQRPAAHVQLQLNLIKWVARRDAATPSDVCSIKDSDGVKELVDGNIALWCGRGTLSSEVEEHVLEFVMKGGGLLYGVTPWGWLQLNPGKSLSALPLWSVLTLAGICFTTECVSGPENGFDVRAALDRNGGIHFGNPEKFEGLEEWLLNTGGLIDVVDSRFGARKWRREILHNVSTLPTVGQPGGLIVYGSQSYPVLADQKHNVILACGQVGKGRFAIFSHGRYLAKMLKGDSAMATLELNLKRWVSMYTYEKDADVYLVNEKTSVHLTPEHKLVWCQGSDFKDEAALQKVLEFVQGGGGLIAGVCPWGWLQSNGGKTLQDLPLSTIMAQAGMSFTTERLSGENIDVPLSLQQSRSGWHLGRAIDEAIKAEQLSLTVMQTIAAHVQHLPQHALHDVGERLRTIAHAHAERLQDCGPSRQSPASDPEHLAFMSFCEVLSLHNMGMSKVPGVEIFPGDFTSSPALQSARMHFESHLAEWHSTGFYLAAGAEMNVRVLSVEGNDSWKVRVGAHTDKLNKKKPLRRWPNICCKKTVASVAGSALKMRSPYGGLIYVKSPSGQGKLEILMEGVVEAPYFDLRDPASKQDWARRRTAPGLWADIGGEYITITLPAKSVRNLEAPWDVMSTWDRVLLSHHDLRGTHPSSGKRQFIVCDEQPSAGYMHAGHPIVTGLDVAIPSTRSFLLNNAALRSRGFWGPFHELGHNMQRWSWTFDGTLEVTCNIFTLYAMDVICGKDPWIHKNLALRLSKIKNYLRDGADFKVWKKSPWVALGVYAQLSHYFGWDSYKRVFRLYESMTPDERPRQQQQKIDKWITLFSEEVGQNLCPLFEFWGVPLTANVKVTLESLPPFLPKDKMTEFAPQRATIVKEQYTGFAK